MNEVDAYIAARPAPIRARLRSIRATIKKAAPRAEESISYRIPAYKLDGKLVYFAAFRNHIGLYPITGLTRAKFARELTRYDGGRARATARFPHDEPIPHGLIAKIVKFRAAENAAARRAGKPRR
jgi:uncharacterized protein YdhG (YjbR/CyaY superfamily)